MYTKTGFKNLIGYNIKGGVNYNINEQHNVYANIGYYSKQPFFNSVYPNNLNYLNPSLTNEKIFGVEAGYGFKSRVFSGNLNLYHTTVEGMDEARSGAHIVKAQVPLAEMFGYVTALRTITSGRATSSMEYDHHAPLSSSIAKAVLEEVKGRTDLV